MADGFEYSATESGPGGITPISLKSRELSLSASGANWSFEPTGPQDELWFHFRVEETWLCARTAVEIVEDTIGQQLAGGPMPVGSPIPAEHLEAIAKWIRAGAPRDRVVPGTSDLLGACLPPPDPLKLDPPPPLPQQGVAVQFQSTAWVLPADSEDELCYATYYDLTATHLVPESAQFDCGGLGGVNNHSGKCFYWNRRVLRQDGQSHHSIISFYNGIYDILYSCTTTSSAPTAMPNWTGSTRRARTTRSAIAPRERETGSARTEISSRVPSSTGRTM